MAAAVFRGALRRKAPAGLAFSRRCVVAAPQALRGHGRQQYRYFASTPPPPSPHQGQTKEEQRSTASPASGEEEVEEEEDPLIGFDVSQLVDGKGRPLARVPVTLTDALGAMFRDDAQHELHASGTPACLLTIKILSLFYSIFTCDYGPFHPI